MSAEQLVLGINIPVAWGEQDAFGHLNNVVYFRYFENVRMYYLERIGVLASLEKERIGVILASTTCDFHKPVVWPSALHVRTGCTHIGNTSFTMEYRITDAHGALVATGRSVQVMYDYNKGCKTAIPPDTRSSIEAIQRSY
ncbi:MAG: acyl-CoA thioesterase [Flavobacteriales bacterium]|nr:acyl-CoA thioesterase [Flavobacteriales bacterium]